MKNIYEEPSLEVVSLDDDLDIIKTSGWTDEDSGDTIGGAGRFEDDGYDWDDEEIEE